jgi:hypothetical protein
MLNENEKLATNFQVKSKERVTNYGEVFTSKREVNAMLELVKQETERVDSRFLEPACGTGNFLTEILERKLKIVENRYKKNQIEFEKYSVIAVSSIYGIDIQKDNVEECRKKLFEIFEWKYTELYPKTTKDDCRSSIKHILKHNIIHGDALTLCEEEDSSKPIIFSEWSAVNGSMMKRRDFTMDNLVNAHLPEYQQHEYALFSDENDPAFLPEPLDKYYPLQHFLKLGEPDDREL